MTDRQLRTAWLCGLAAVMVGPTLLWIAVAPAETMWLRLSMITGLVALSALVCAAVLPSRIRSLNRAFGIESVIEVHRFLGSISGTLILAHLACVVAANPANATLLDFAHAPGRAQAAVAATVLLVVLVLLAALRRRIGLGYEFWRWTHLGLATAVFVFSFIHIWLLDHAVRIAAMYLALVGLGAIVAGVAAYRWVWRGMLDPTTEFVVHEVRAESATVSTLVLGPRGQDALDGSWGFAPGQFAWIRLEPSPAAEEHPFTIASSAHLDCTEFTIRHAGDFTRRIRRLTPGAHVWVDGPHGAFTNDVGSCDGYVLIAAGVGITPMMSILRTAADRGDTRPYRLIVVAGSPEDILFREELGFLRHHMDLEVTEILRRPRDGWTGHTGGLSIALISLVLGSIAHPEDVDFFICGPPALIDDSLTVLNELDVATTRIHTELFDFV